MDLLISEVLKLKQDVMNRKSKNENMFLVSHKFFL